MKVFISQPMCDKTDEDITAERQKAIDDLTKNYPEENIEVIDSYFKDAPHEAKPLYYLGKSFELLSEADLAYFCKDWYKYRGCKLEHKACADYGIPTTYYNQR